MKKTIYLCFLLLLSSAYVKSNETPEALKVKKVKLENGFTIYFNVDHTQPNIQGTVVVKGGAKRDPKDATGIAHYFEHIMFKGSEKLGTVDYKKEKVYLDSIEVLYDELALAKTEEEKEKIQLHINSLSLKAADFAIPNELDKVLKNMGGKGVNAYTSMECIAYHNTFPSNQLEKWLKVYYDRFEAPVFRLFQSELETVYEEKNMYADDRFSTFEEEIARNFYKKHPYGQQTVLGSVEHLKSPSLRKMKEYYETFYVPNNMALILSGSFDPEQALPMIKSTFGNLKYKEVPPAPVYKEEPFNGREQINMRHLPIKVGVIAYRAVNETHPDANTLNLALNVLSNYSSTGLLDQLLEDNKLLEVFADSYFQLDMGGIFIYFAPKLIGQRLKKAEKLIMNEIDKLKKGEFSDTLLRSIKQSLITYHNESLENVNRRSYMITSNFLADEDWNDFLNFPEKINKLTKEDVVACANKYFTDNRLVVHSRMGFPKKEKIDKPNYKAVTPKNTEAKSAFAEEINAMPTTPSIPQFIEFGKDVNISDLQDKVHLYKTKNPVNNIFSLRMTFGMGANYNNLTPVTAMMLSSCGTEKLSSKELKKKMQEIGLEFYAYSGKSNFTINFSGLEENLDESLALINDLLNNTTAKQSVIKKISQRTKYSERYETKDPYAISQALSDYALYEDKSSYLKRKTSKEIKKMKIETLLNNFKEVQNYELDMHYCGQLAIEDVKSKMKKHLQLKKDRLASKEFDELKRKEYKENTILLVDDKKALQSQIYFLMEGNNIDEKSRKYAYAFNSYFGGDMNSIIFQEIREFRSLGYSAWGNFRTPIKNGRHGYFKGFVGTQADKTLDAIEAYTGLLKDMPEKKERLETVKNSLTQSINTSRPSFRYLSSQVAYWNKQGYKNDPRKERMKTYKTLSFDDITKFYKDNLKGKAYVITIVGDAKRFDKEELKKYGKVVEVKKKDIYHL